MQIKMMGAELEASEVWPVQGKSGLCVASRHPPVNLGRNLFPRKLKSGEVFLSHPIQQVQWHSATTVALTSTITHQALRAVVRCSHVPRWGQTK
jgi:hypothetical protein